MRILHTSDWHLGQHFIGKSREEEHRVFLDWLKSTINNHKVDALIVAGDIFDTGTPPSYARRMYNQFIADLRHTCCQQVIIIGGNHDSVSTLNESRDVFACLNTTVVGGVPERPEDEVVVLNGADGKPGAVVCAIPYIRPRDVLESQAGESNSDKQLALQNAIAAHYQKVFAKASRHKLPVVATGHLTTVNGQLSESVREIYIGTLHAFPASGFPPADYIALGHLHKPQRVSDHDHIRYSGSPIPLGFDEADSEKQVLLVDLEKDRKPVVTEIKVPFFRSLQHIKGSLADIEKRLEQLDTSADLTTWLDIEVTVEDYLSDVRTPVDEMLADKPMEALKVRRRSEKQSSGLAREAAETLEERDVTDVFKQRLSDESLKDDRVKALTSAFHEILDLLNDEEAKVQEKEVSA